MQEDKVKELLLLKFNQILEHPYKRRIIFWYDHGGRYSDFADSLKEADIKVVKITKNEKEKLNNIFAIKYLLEYEDKESNYLVYSPYARPLDAENLLLDIERYSELYIADETSMIIEEFGFNRNYRDLINDNIMFFDSKERRGKLEKILPKNPADSEIEMGMLAALSGSKLLDFEEILKILFIKGLEENRAYDEISKYCNKDLFKKYVEYYFGLDGDNLDLKNLFKTMVIIHMYYTIKQEPPIKLSNKAKSKAQSVYVFIDHFMNSIKEREEYLQLSKSVEQELNILTHIKKIPFEKLVLVNTFRVIDLYIIDSIADYILNGLTDYDSYIEYINIRRDITPWDDNIGDVYSALVYAVELLKLKKNFEVRERDADEIFGAYISKYYMIDLNYRKFYEFYDLVKMRGIEKLEEIRENIEKLYINVFQNEIMGYWTKSLEQIKDKWSLINYINQKDFYKENISNSNERVFVIISDALRYEVAVELRDMLSSKIENNKIELQAMFGNIPSYTRLGMASLLPHKDKLEYNPSTILVAGADTASTEQREKILKLENEKSIAIQHDKFKTLGRNELREIVKGTEVVYIYHNAIDEAGDKASSEIDVFEACKKAISEILDIVKYASNTLSASNIIITADHGFIYQRDTLEIYDKLDLADMNISGSPNKRYVYTNKEIDKDGTIKIDMNYIFKESDIKAIIPKDNLRFKCQGGGINYVHGGAALQEIVIPLIKYKNMRNRVVEITKVNLEFITLARKIRNNVTNFKFIQVEGVSDVDKIAPRMVKIGIYDGDQPISSEKQISLNSKEENTHIDVSLTIKAGEYEKSKGYYLRVVDMESNEILIDEKFNIDIGITNDFEF